MPPTYRFPAISEFSPLLATLAATEDALARIDERLRRNPLAEGLRARLAFAEACASRLAQGELVHVEDLVLFDAGAFDGPISPELSSALTTLQLWRRAEAAHAGTLLLSDRPGDPVAPIHGTSIRSDPLYDPLWDEPGRLAAWREVLLQSQKLPAVLAAAILWDAWLVLQPEQRGAWRAPLLASLALKARGKTPNLLLPIDLGQRYAKYRRHPAHGFEQRIPGLLEWMNTAATRVAKDLDGLLLAERLLRHSLARKRRNSQLSKLIALLLSRPLVSAPMAAKHLKVSQQAIRCMLRELAPTPRELSGRSRYRVWAVM